MRLACSFRRALLVSAIALVPGTQAMAAPCAAAAGSALTIGQVATVPSGAAAAYAVRLANGESVIVDLLNVTPPAAPEEGDEHAARAADGDPRPRGLSVCDARGGIAAPLPSDVFSKGGSLVTIEEGERLRFTAPAAGSYTIMVAAGETEREILVRKRADGQVAAPVIKGALGQNQSGIVSSNSQLVYSFTAAAGQWVELAATSDKDTILRLAGPDRDGNYAQIAENDDSVELNPLIRRKLPVAGTYFVQIDSLAAEAGEFALVMRGIDAPKPPPPPAALRIGTQVSGRLADQNAVVLYALPVVAGHAYRLDLTAPYDGVVAIGLPNPVEPEDGNDKPDAGFAEIKSQDANLTGTEKLAFTARSTGSLLVRVKRFGDADADQPYSLLATDLGL